MRKAKVLTLRISLGTYKKFIYDIIEAAQLRQSNYTCVANVHMIAEAFYSNSYSSIVNNADIVTPDGKPIVWALKFLYGIKQERVAGMDLLPDILVEAEKRKIPVYFYGGTDSMLVKTHEYLNHAYPNLIISGFCSPPFRELAIEEEEEMTNKINQSEARIVFVALGCPKQEKWMSRMKDKINSVMIGVGGALPVLIGMQKRAPLWMQKSGLEWFFRLYQEPRRLFKRYASTNTLFTWLLIKEYFRIKIIGKK
tara:strand:+ start:388 stop:1146 length:759 start_codon:yes stop_codon:yes gene_type:complete